MRARTALRLGAAATGVTAAAGVGTGLLAWRLYRRLRAGEDLAGKVVLITGSSRGLGFALAQELAGHGARLAICARGQHELERARRELVSMGAEVLAISCDVGVHDDVQALVNEVVHRFGTVDILV